MSMSRQGLCVLLAVWGWLSAAMVSAQSPLNTLTGGVNSGAAGGGIYFDLQVNASVAITQIDALCSGNTLAGPGQMEVWACPITHGGNLTNPANWTILGSATAPVGPGAMTSFVLAAPIALPLGTYGIGLRALGFGHGYTTGNGTNQTFSTAELTLQAGAAQNSFLSGSTFTPRVFNGSIFYQGGGPPADDD